MRRVRAPRALLALLLSALLTVATLLAGAGPAAAGGPTSVLLASPTDQTSAALYYTDPRYAELEELLHGTDAALEESDQDPGSVTRLNLTWLIHDVTVWRIDSLLLDGSGSAWVSTSGEWGGGVQPSTSGESWTRLRHADRIRQLVASLGLLGGAEQAAAEASVAEDGAAPTSATPPSSPTVREETRWFSLTGWRWAVPGLLVGALGIGVALRRRPADQPRQELVDRTPVTTQRT